MTERQRKDAPETSDLSTLEADGILAASLYEELHKMAIRRMRFERPNHTLQPTALVHEAYLRLAEASGSVWQDRVHFLAVAARVMRHILVDHARARGAGKRGAGAVQMTLDENTVSQKSAGADVLAVDQALLILAKLDSRQAKILELHFFAGMTFEEIASVLRISARTVKRDWSMARDWMRGVLSKRI
jgi:RNA polymerase sigma-70 factor, ECF subfamily